jgi:hypothetical protein
MRVTGPARASRIHLVSMAKETARFPGRSCHTVRLESPAAHAGAAACVTDWLSMRSTYVSVVARFVSQAEVSDVEQRNLWMVGEPGNARVPERLVWRGNRR